MRPLLALACLLAAGMAAAQPVVFRGRVVALGGEALPPGLTLRAEQIGPVDLGQSGEFRLALPPGTARFTLRVVRPAVEVVYPPGGLVSVPADPAATTVVVVGPGAETVVAEALAARDRQLEQRLRAFDVRFDARQDSVQRDLRAVLEAVAAVREEDLPEILALLRLRADDLRTEAERARAREAHLPALSATLSDYVLKVRDLRDALDLLGPDAHLSRAVVEAMQERVERYDTAYTALDTQGDAFLQQVRAYWPEAAHALDLQALLTLARGEIHHDRVLPLNPHLVVVQRVHTRAPPERDEVRYSQRRIAEVAADLRPRIDRLSALTTALLAALARP